MLERLLLFASIGKIILPSKASYKLTLPRYALSISLIRVHS